MEELWWKERYVDRRGYIYDHLEDLALNGEEALTILLIDFFNQHGIMVDHAILANKLKRDAQEIDELLSRLTSKGYLNIVYENGKIQFSIDGVFASQKKAETPFDESLFNLFEHEFARPLSQVEMQRMSEWMGTYEQKLIVYALRQAMIYNKKNFDYIDRILSEWKSKNITAEQIEKGEKI